MASWKKIIVSGSAAELSQLNINGTQQITPLQSTTYLTGSFTGSFSGDGALLTGIPTSLAFSGSSGYDVVNLKTETLIFAGTTDQIETFVTDNQVRFALTNDVVVNGDLTVNGGDLITTASTFNLVNTGATTVNIAGAATNLVNIGNATGLVNVKGDLAVDGDLTVSGDLSYLNVTNLYVEDRFVLLNSGSVAPSDGGIIVDQNLGVGKAFVYDTDTNRWGFTGSLDSSVTSVAPDAFVAAVIDKNVIDSDNAEYQKVGNIRIETNGDIFIYS